MRRALHQLFRRSASGAPGYTLIEALLMIVVLGIMAVGVGNSLIAVARSTESNENTLLIDNALVNQMEILRASWQSYPIGLQTSQITIGNSTYPMTLDVERASPNSQGVQATFVSLTIQIAGKSMCTYVSN